MGPISEHRMGRAPQSRTPAGEPASSPRAPDAAATIALTLRYFAGAAEAAGRQEERLEVPAGTTVAALREQLAGRSTRMATTISISSLLVNSRSVPTDSLQPLQDGDAIDILPPFAGG